MFSSVVDVASRAAAADVGATDSVGTGTSPQAAAPANATRTLRRSEKEGFMKACDEAVHRAAREPGDFARSRRRSPAGRPGSRCAWVKLFGLDTDTPAATQERHGQPPDPLALRGPCRCLMRAADRCPQLVRTHGLR